MSRRRIAVVVAGAVVAAAAAGSAAPSRAVPSPEEMRAARQRLMVLERDFQLASERYNLLDERLRALQADIARHELEIEHVGERMRVRERAAVALARKLYKGGSMSAFEAVLSSQSVAEISTRLTYLETSEAHQISVFERLIADRKELGARVARLQSASERVAAARAELTRLRASIENKVASQRDEVERLNRVIAAAERRADARAAAAAAAAAAAEREPRVDPAAAVEAAAASNPRARAAVDAALSQLGKPYRWGAAGPDAYDCSGLTMWAWAHAGVSLPHNSTMQYEATTRVARSDWEPGDLLFFGTPIHHVGMYLGNGRMVEAPYSGSQVRINSAYRDDYVGAGRPGV